MSDIFISYASQDRPSAERLSIALAAEGWTVWWDRSIPPGKSFARMIEDALNGATCVVVLWSRISRDSDWVQNEARHGHHRGALIPALIEDVTPPFEFQHIQAASLMDWDGGAAHPGYRQLVSAISDVAGAPPKPDAEAELRSPVEAIHPPAAEPPADPRKPMPKKLIWLAAAFILVLAVSGIGAVVYERNTAQDQARAQDEAEAVRAPEDRNARKQAKRPLEVLDRKMVARTDVNVHQGPGTHYDKLAVLPHGTFVAVTGLVDDWYQVMLADDRQGYVFMELLGDGGSVADGSAYKPGDTFRDCGVCPKMIVVPAGTFLMGLPADEPVRDGDEGPQHWVTIPKPFAVGENEVTLAEWDACVEDGGCSGYLPEDEGWGRGRRPAINVSWKDAREYTQWLSDKTGQDYRLLTEAEWEYVARAGTTTAYWWGDAFDSGKANNGSRTTKVNRYPANPWGVRDIAGNVWEWVADCYDENAYTKHQSYPAMLGTLDETCIRALRGGSWASDPRDLRSAGRDRNHMNYRDDDNGFRVARTL